MGNMISGGTNLIGGSMQAIAANKAAGNMRDTYAQERTAQDLYTLNSLNAWRRALQQTGVGVMNQQQQQGAAQRMAAFQQVNQVPMYSAMPVQGNTGRTNARLGVVQNNRAQLGGYGDMALQQNIARARSDDVLNRIANLAAGQAGTLPYRMYDAQHSMDELAFQGQMIQALGGAAGNFYDMYGKKPSKES